MHADIFWHNQLKKIPVTDDRHIETLRFYTQQLLSYPNEWGNNNPLIEVMAERI